MKGSARLSIALVACGLVALACDPIRTVSPPVAPPANVAPSASPSAASASVLESVNGISFERPSNWSRWQPNEHYPWNDGPLIYLSTDPLLSSCATAPEATPNPANSQGRACAWPLTELNPDGVLVTWLTTRILERLPTTGEKLEVNAAPAGIQITRPGDCGTIKADETIEVLVPIGQPTPLSNIAVVACLRGPDLAAAEAKLRTMLTSSTVQLGALAPRVGQAMSDSSSPAPTPFVIPSAVRVRAESRPWADR